MFCGGDFELLAYTSLSSGVRGPNHLYSVLEQIHEETFTEKASNIRKFGEVDLNGGC